MSKRYRGELLEGKSHKEGGIPVQVADSHMVEMEGGEGVVNKRSMSSQDTFDFEGKDLTTCEIVSELNQEKGDGVAFDCDSVEGKQYKYQVGGITKGMRFLPPVKYHLFQLF